MLLNSMGDKRGAVEVYLNSLPRQFKYILLTFDDCEEFYAGFRGRNRFAIDDLLDYREHKIKNKNVELEDFVELCSKRGVKEAFVSVFMQEIKDYEVEIIKDAIHNNKITLEKIFESFKMNSNVNVMKYIL